MGWRWHKYVLHHTVHRLNKIEPDHRMGGINVYVQNEFRPPMAHRQCSCGKTWI